MTRAKNVKKARRAERARAAEPARASRRELLPVIAAAVGLAALVAVVYVFGFAARDSGGGAALDAPVGGDPGPIHIHGLGVNPADGALYIATHSGLFRAPEGETEAERVGDLHQDTMGFSVVGPDRFIGSGHPDLRQAQRENLPPHLGLIESQDGGETWNRISLLGEADFHVLRSAAGRVYGYDATNGRIMISRDGGRTWVERRPPGPVVDIAVDPADATHVLVATAGAAGSGLFESSDDGESWKRAGDVVGLLAWPGPGRLYAVTGGGLVLRSADGGVTFARSGDIGGEPAAFVAESGRDLYAALHDGTVKRSTDGGATWDIRSRP